MFILHFYVYVEDALVVCGLSLQFPLQLALWRIKSPASGQLAQLFIQVHIKENIKALRHWPLWCDRSSQTASSAENVSIWWRHHEQFCAGIIVAVGVIKLAMNKKYSLSNWSLYIPLCHRLNPYGTPESNNIWIKRSSWNVYFLTYISMVSCQKDPTRHAYAWQIGPFWQDTLDIWTTFTLVKYIYSYLKYT